MNIAVTGATGTQGGAVARLLTERGHDVRRVTRNPEHPGDVHGDFDDPASLTEAFSGADGLFLMTPLSGPTAAPASRTSTPRRRSSGTSPRSIHIGRSWVRRRSWPPRVP